MLRLHSYQYHRPRSILEAVELLALHPEDGMLIAGGTDVMPNMKHRLFTPNHVIGVRGIHELRGIRIENDEIVIGAGESLTAVSRNAAVRKHAVALAQAAGSIAGPQLRNMGTMGGNVCLDTRCTYYNQTHFWRNALGYCLKKDGTVCHVTKVGKKCVAAHSADTPPVLISLDASIDLVSAEGTRSVKASDFFIADGIWNNVRKPNEIVARIRVPVPPKSTRTAFIKMRERKSIDFSLLSMALAVEMEGDSVRSCRLVVTALGSRPRDVTGLEKVSGKKLNEVVDAVADRAYQQCHPLENMIVDPDWRRAMIPVYVKRLFEGVT